MKHRALFDACEPRRLFTFGAGYTNFGDGGLASIPDAGALFDGYAPQVVSLPDGRVMTYAGGQVRYLTPEGELDTKRGRNGRGGVHNVGALLVVIDPQSGEFARLSSANFEGEQADRIEWYDAKGKYKFGTVIDQPFDFSTYTKRKTSSSPRTAASC
ncbi:MAG: hypothetical protein QM702_03660 [Rubrivivax sp.]